jgi:hypothetical protein
MKDSPVVLHLDAHPAHDRQQVEERLARALRRADAAPEAVSEKSSDVDASSRELLQLAWDRAEQETDELRTELRLMRQRYQEAERQLLARINHRKRLQQAILESAGQPPASA